MSVKKTQDPIIVTPPKPLPIPSPTYSLEEGEQGTSEAEVVTEPKARFVGSTHEEIPEWPGPYHVTENGLYECAGYEFSTDLLVEVSPKGLTEITITENGTYKPSDYDGYSKVIVDVFSPTLETLNATENKTYTAPEGKAYDEVVVNVPSSGNTLKTLLDATKSCYHLFYNYQGNDIADLIHYDDTSGVKSMGSMFAGCYFITSIPLLNTSNVTSMNSMFNGCSYLTSIPLFNTSKVTNMQSMFNSCSALTSIPLLDTSNVTTMQNMFNYCYALTSVPALDASACTNLGNIFTGCPALHEIKMTGMKVSFNISASTLFTREALVEIITNCASVETSGITLTMGATNLAKLTQADIDLATSKGWTIA